MFKYVGEFMKKKNFIDGAIISTASLVICKIMGLLYVIPFYRIIGTQGGALYSYAYSIYAMFLNLSTIGIPAAISKIICEYETLGYQFLKNKSYRIASNILNYVGIVAFLIMFIFAEPLARQIIGDVTGGNSVESVATAIRVVSTALLVVPRLSIIKGYFQGNKYLRESSICSIIEQFVRIAIIIAGSFLIVKVLKLSVDIAVYIATFAATIGAFSAYIYLKMKRRKVVSDESEEIVPTEEEKKFSTWDVVKKIVVYAIPFVIIALLQSAYNIVDTFTVVRTLTSLGYTTAVAETTISVITTWASKLNMIILSLSIGMTGSLIPNIVESNTKKEFKDVNHKLNLSFKMFLILAIPMAVGMSFLAEPIWHVFYDVNSLCSDIFRFSVLQIIIHGLYVTIITISQAMNETKITISSLIISFILKAALNIPLMHLFNSIGIPAYYATTVSDAIAKIVALGVVLVLLNRKFKFTYNTLVPFILKIFLGIGVMFGVLSLTKLVYFSNASIVSAIITIIICTLLGAAAYFLVINKFKLLEEILGSNYKDKILRKLKLKRK